MRLVTGGASIQTQRKPVLCALRRGRESGVHSACAASFTNEGLLNGGSNAITHHHKLTIYAAWFRDSAHDGICQL